MIEFIKNFIPYAVVVGQILALILVIFYFIDKKSSSPVISPLMARYGIHFAFIVALSAMLGSLFYSDVAGYEPCKFCWFQRIFMYSQTVTLFIAILRKDIKIWISSLSLSIGGGTIALNHYILQTTGSSILPCSAIGQSVSCNKVFVMHFGYITIPLMALTAFILIIISMLYVRRADKNGTPIGSN